MTDTQQLTDLLHCNDIDLTRKLTEQFSELCMKPEFADVLLIIGDERIPAHKVVLAARSDYFRSLLYREVPLGATKPQEIQLNVSADRFKMLLRYVYSGHISLPSTMDNESDIIDLLIIANQYGFQELVGALSEHLYKHITMKNVATILDAANIYDFHELANLCLGYMDDNASELLMHPNFTNFRKDIVVLIFKRDTFVAKEMNIFQAIQKWHAKHPDDDITELVGTMRLELFTVDQLMEVVRPSNIVAPDKILNAIEKQRHSSDLPYRMWPDRNVATAELNAAIYLRNGTVALIDLNKNILYHEITDHGNHGIVIRLGRAYAINHIRMRLCDVDRRVYGYLIEVSRDNHTWDCVVDYSQAHGSSWQQLYFERRPVRYIRIIGLNTDHADKRFIILGLEIMSATKNVPKMSGDIVIPTKNVATVGMGALALNENNVVQNDILKAEINYDGHLDFSIRYAGSGYMLIRLSQPYYIDSVRLLLWDRDDRTYRFFVETSLDKESWHVIVDKRQECARAWQNLFFVPHAIVYIRVICTRMSAPDGVFRCVHFECPLQSLEDISKTDETKDRQKNPRLNEVNDKSDRVDRNDKDADTETHRTQSNSDLQEEMEMERNKATQQLDELQRVRAWAERAKLRELNSVNVRSNDRIWWLKRILAVTKQDPKERRDSY